MYAGFTKQGCVDETSYLVGHWSEIVAVVSATDYFLGNCPEGTLEIGREFYVHEDVSFPRVVDLVTPIRVGMKFSGKLEEVHKQNVSFLLGQTLIPSANYIYVGALGVNYYFTLRGRRMRISDNIAVEFCMWKCLVTSLFSIGGGDEVQGSPFEVTAHDDTDADYGGSSTGPLGYIWVPNKGS